MKLASRLLRLFDREGLAHGQSALDAAVLLRGHTQAAEALESAHATCERSATAASQQRNALAAARDQTAQLAARGREARAAAQQVREALERAKLLALNAGLEGARLGDSGGRALLAVADEMRSALGRGLSAADEYGALLVQLEREREKLKEQLEHARDRATQLSDSLSNTQAAQRVASGALAELGENLQRATGSDPELVRVIAEAAGHARGLAEALSELLSRRQRAFVLRALEPALRPLLRLMRDLDDPSADGPVRDERP
ncbi:MAG TPA: methyl-accepting chemotaxis protein [Polyangiaceae bacterium]|nr:methyl-accepting chemotaxis protein [Polyangiaceae bacterium]